MSQARPLFKGATYFITRRCTQRQFLFRPSKRVNRILRFCLAAAAERFGIRIHAFVFMSNHYHLVATDVDGRLSDFLHWLHTHISKCLNAHHGRSQNLFDTRQPNLVVVPTAADVLEKIAYVLTNPVAAALVRKAEQWPGEHSAVEDYGSTIRAHKPRAFFRKHGAVEDVARFELEVPPGFEDHSPRRFRRRLAEVVAEREAELRARMRRTGRAFLGVRAVKEASPFSSPHLPAEETGARVPRLACKDPELRQTLLARLRAFVDRYREALEEYCCGDTDAVFPAGTYRMRVQFGVSCERSPPGWRIPAYSA